MAATVGCFQSLVSGAAPDAGAEDAASAPTRRDAAMVTPPDAPMAADSALDATADEGAEDAAPDAPRDPCAGAVSRRVLVEFMRLEADCPWREGDNLPPAQERATARVEQTFAFTSPSAGGELCALRFDFTRDGEAFELRYDDNFFLVMDGVVLAASDRDLVARLPREGDLVLWEWNAIAGAVMNVVAVRPYCLGEEDGIGNCLVPDTDSLGAFRLDLPLERFPELIARAGEAEVTLRFVTVGDNDPETDCSHGGVTFELSYAFLP